MVRWLFVHSPGLLEERMRLGGNQQSWDRPFVPIFAVLFLGWFAVVPIDAARFGWSHVPLGLRAIGVGATLWSFYLLFIVFRENPYLSGVVRLREERGHSVISTGQYRYVRHPMYSGALVLFAGASLWLGSWWGLAVTLGFAATIAVRAVLEERTLARELLGYDAYMAQVRYRLIPHIW